MNKKLLFFLILLILSLILFVLVTWSTASPAANDPNIGESILRGLTTAFIIIGIAGTAASAFSIIRKK